MSDWVRIGRSQYQLEKLGEGSFADLYRAVPRLQSSATLFVKHLQEKYQSNRTVRARLSLEYRLLREFAPLSSQVPQAPRSGKISSRPYVAYAYIEGASLMSMLKSHDRHDFSLRRSLKIMQSLLGALETLHGRTPSVVHSDISPENILIFEDQVSLIDFGCAQEITPERSARQWLGKPGYLSPEQAQGQSWGLPSDIYQCGVVFYEMLRGRRWNTGSTSGERIAFSSQPTGQHAAIGKVPPRARPLLRSMLDANPASRPASLSLCRQRLLNIERLL